MAIDLMPGFGAFTPAAGGGGSFSAWNPSDIGTALILSNADRTVTAGAATYGRSVRGTQSRSTGKRVVEIESVLNASNYPWFGLATSSARLEDYPTEPGDTLNFLGMYLNSTNFYYVDGGGQQNIGTVGFTTGANNEAIFTMAVDLDAELIWVSVSGGDWNNSGAADPATGTGGWDYSGASFGPLFPYAGGDENTGPTYDSWLLNTGQTAFAKTIPSGFSAWG